MGSALLQSTDKLFHLNLFLPTWWNTTVVLFLDIFFITIFKLFYHDAFWGAPPWSSGSVLDHRSLPPVIKSRRGHIWRLFRLWLRLSTFGGRSAHLAYLVHKSGRKTTIFIMTLFRVQASIKTTKYGFSQICLC